MTWFPLIQDGHPTGGAPACGMKKATRCMTASFLGHIHQFLQLNNTIKVSSRIIPTSDPGTDTSCPGDQESWRSYHSRG